MIILASGSPRRKELLSRMGLKFEVVTSDVEESHKSKTGAAIVKELSGIKARDVYNKLEKAGKIKDGTLIIAADTLVFLDDEILGKPADEADASRMLKELSGRTHKVRTGVTLLYKKNGKLIKKSFCECSTVEFAELEDWEIQVYISSKEPMDKAGAYGIQGLGSRFVKGIRGDYFNIVGLPVAALYRQLKAIGFIASK